MPSFLIPRNVSAHRHAAIALFRTLLRRSTAAPLSEQSRDEACNVVRNRFKQSEHLHSYRRLKVAFEAGYEAVDRLDAAIAGDGRSVGFIEELLAKSPAKVKQAKPRAVSSANASRADAAEDVSPKISLLDRPLPLEQLSCRRHVPVLFSAGSIPVLRLKKPQPPALSGFIKHRIRQRQQRWNRRHALSDQIDVGEHEDHWDDLVMYQNGEKNQGEPSWSDEPWQARREVENKLKEEGRKNVEMAEKMQAVVDREQASFDKEKQEGKERRRLERQSRHEVTPAGVMDSLDAARSTP